MENVVDALKMTFAVIVFIVALAIVFSIIGPAVKTSDVILLKSQDMIATDM